MANKIKFHTIIKQVGNNTGIEVPEDVVTKLGAGKRPPVYVTLNGYTYRNSIAVMSGAFMISVSADVRSKANVKGGDALEVTLQLDTDLREVTVPPGLKKALANDAGAKANFDKLSYSAKQRYVLPINDAKTEETRDRRIAKAITAIRAGKK